MSSSPPTEDELIESSAQPNYDEFRRAWDEGPLTYLRTIQNRISAKEKIMSYTQIVDWLNNVMEAAGETLFDRKCLMKLEDLKMIRFVMRYRVCYFTATVFDLAAKLPLEELPQWRFLLKSLDNRVKVWPENSLRAWKNNVAFHDGLKSILDKNSNLIAAMESD